MITIKNKQALQKMKIAGGRLALLFEQLKPAVVAGISTLELNEIIETMMKSLELKAECKVYRNYKHAACISVNEVVVHGVPSEKIIIKEGDLVKVDIVGSYQGYCADMARPFVVGKVPEVAHRLIAAGRQALDNAIALIKPGVYLSDLSASIQRDVEAAGFGVIRDFAGHGIGKKMHEEPEIPNFGVPGKGPKLRPGMVLAIEPMITEGSYEIVIAADGWTARTRDNSLGGHVEDTVAVTIQGYEILTCIRNEGDAHKHEG